MLIKDCSDERNVVMRVGEDSAEYDINDFPEVLLSVMFGAHAAPMIVSRGMMGYVMTVTDQDI
jgi:hypothetical protein